MNYIVYNGNNYTAYQGHNVSIKNGDILMNPKTRTAKEVIMASGSVWTQDMWSLPTLSTKSAKVTDELWDFMDKEPVLLKLVI